MVSYSLRIAVAFSGEIDDLVFTWPQKFIIIPGVYGNRSGELSLGSWRIMANVSGEITIEVTDIDVCMVSVSGKAAGEFVLS